MEEKNENDQACSAEVDAQVQDQDHPGTGTAKGPSVNNNPDPDAPLNLDTIPVEVLLQIFNFVDATDLLRRVSLVSKYFHAILSNEMTWKIKQEKRWGTDYPPVPLFPDSRSPSVTKDQHDEVDLDGSGTFNQDPAPSNNNNAGPLPPVPQQQPTQPGSSTCQYSGSFTLSRFPWSRACVKREEQIKLWSDYTNQHQQGNTNCRSRIVHSTVSSHIGCIDSVHLFVRNDTMLLACGSRDRTISVWDVQRLLTRDRENETTGEGERAVRNNNGSRINILNRAHDGWIWDFTVNSSNLLSCSWDRSAKAWDFNTWQTTGEFKSNAALLSISSTDNLTAIGSFNRKVVLLDPRTSFTSSSSTNNSNSPTPKPVHTYVAHTRSVLSVGLDSNYVISCGEDGLCVKHDIRAHKRVSCFRLPSPPPPPPQREAPNNNNGEFDFHDEDPPVLPPAPPVSPPPQAYPTCMSFRDTRISLPYFYIGDNTGTVHLVDLINFTIESSTKLHDTPVRGVFHNLGSVLTCSKDGKLEVRDPSRGLKRIGNVDVGEKIELPCVHSVNNVVACGGGDGVVRLWGVNE